MKSRRRRIRLTAALEALRICRRFFPWRTKPTTQLTNPQVIVRSQGIVALDLCLWVTVIVAWMALGTVAGHHYYELAPANRSNPLIWWKPQPPMPHLQPAPRFDRAKWRYHIWCA